MAQSSNLFLSHSSFIYFPYELSWNIDALWLALGLVGTALGLYLRKKKESTAVSELNTLEKANLSFIDRRVAGNYSKRSDKISDVPFFSSFIIPSVLLLDSSINRHYLPILILFLITLSTVASIYTITNGLTNRFRPLVLNNLVPMHERLESNGRNAFFSGHVAITAAAYIFTARVFTDYNANSVLVPYVWVLALSIPIFVGWYRIQAGKHYPTDVAVGYLVGVVIGMMVPELH